MTQPLGPIPGLAGTGTIPNLGRGTPGGRAAVAGLPGGPALSQIPGLPTLGRVPSIAPQLGRVPGLPSPAVATPGTVALGGGALAHTQDRLSAAMNILQQVKFGQMNVTRAQRLLADLTPLERQTLTRTILNQHAREGGLPPTDELTALRALPGYGGKNVGQTAAMDPTNVKGVGANLVSDLGQAVVGMPAGIYEAGKSFVQDLPAVAKTAMGDPTVPTHLWHNVVKPIGENYARTYGPALSGNFGLTASRMAQHPLGPILDVASLVSGGLGASARIGEAMDALRAAKIADVPGQEATAINGIISKPYKGIDVQPMAESDRMNLLHEIRSVPWNGPQGPMAQQLAQQTVINPGPRVLVARDANTGELLGVASHHPDGPEVERMATLATRQLKPGTGATLLHSAVKSALDRGAKTMDLLSSHSAEGFYERQGLTPVMRTDLPGGQVPSGVYEGELGRTMQGGKTTVGNQYDVRAQTAAPGEPPRFAVIDKDTGKVVANNLPDQQTAVAHAQSLISPRFAGQPIQAFLKGGGARGQLLDRLEQARGITHEAETQRMMDEIQSVLDDSTIRQNRRSLGDVYREVVGDIKATHAAGIAKSVQMGEETPAFISPEGWRGAGRAYGALGTTMREASDLVRAGAIYLRPAYLPNNWVGNAFMNMVHQGVLAPVNLAKSLVMDNQLGKRYTAVVDKAMGQNPATVALTPKGRGYVASLTNPLAHQMGQLADQPFRRAAFLHEARRMGYSKIGDVQQLIQRADGGDQAALRDIATAGRKAQEEIVKFGQMNETERALIRHILFVYSWVKGSGRYAARFPLQHPIQSNIYNQLSQNVGIPTINQELGGRPTFLAGAIPVGRDKNGNPIIINPFSLNPLGTAVDVGRSIAGTISVLRGQPFNQYNAQDITSALNPLVGSYLQARTGGQTFAKRVEKSIAPLRLAHELQYPGSGSIYPTSRTEALGSWIGGSMFPRVADATALQKAVEREQMATPIARIPTDMKVYKQLTGQDIPQSLVQPYTQDLQGLQRLKDYQKSYAQSHGQSGFRNLPPQNKVDAAIEWLRRAGLANDAQIQSYKDTAKGLDDADANTLANILFAQTGLRLYKQTWDSLMSQARGLRKSRQR